MFLLDTHVVSELRKARAGKASASVVQWAQSIDAAQLYLSVITLQVQVYRRCRTHLALLC